MNEFIVGGYLTKIRYPFQPIEAETNNRRFAQWHSHTHCLELGQICQCSIASESALHNMGEVSLYAVNIIFEPWDM